MSSMTGSHMTSPISDAGGSGDPADPADPAAVGSTSNGDVIAGG